jgi:hypothetical protein
VLHTPRLAAPDFAVLDEAAADEVVLAEGTDPALVVIGVPAPEDPDLLLMEETTPVDAGCVLAGATGAVDPALLFVELTTTAGVELAAGTELIAAPANLVHNPTAAELFASSSE